MIQLPRFIAGATLGVIMTTLPMQQAQAGAFVHLFEWKWSDVAQECENFLGPKGFSAVQVSPPQEHIQGGAWWTRYQPVSYQLNSRSGDASAFADMVQRCNAAGVDVYADAVINHMANGSGTGTASSYYDSGSFSFPVYSGNDFHTPCGINPEDYGTDAWRVRNCQLVGLPDLDTDAAYVQNTIAGYLNHLTSVGVKGIRIDAAKHMAPGDISGILSRVNEPLYVFQEVIDLGGEAVSAGEYTGTSDVTEFRYSSSIGNVFKNQKLAYLNSFGESWGFLAGGNAVVFTDNHDNQRGHGAGGSNVVTYKDGSLYNLANVFMLAWPYGYPKVMSSYGFSNGDQGPPAQSVYQNGSAECGGAWICEHRWGSIANMVEFRNITDGTGVSGWWDNGGNQIAFSRGDKGFVAINREGGNLFRTFSTFLPDGDYRDVAGDGSCVTVQGGQVALDIPAMQAAALHVGADCNGDSADNNSGNDNAGDTDKVSVTFQCANGITSWGHSVYITGNNSDLGNWSPAGALKLDASNYPTWAGTFEMPADSSVEWKCIKRSESDPSSQLVWQSGANNSLQTGSSGSPMSSSGAF
ncbi:carbohydrate-binding module family 20 domain-containing protein [Marinobacter adhaerens]|uniref:carbohydrate-binding module family 20 domain-containing protein n=1 Tax=Marinobacter adhaerens TaxID=1033846 RepID=UPI001E2FAC5E|nr:carbohydrate-binding module family 20 domain-containing protein [Marinobacter adhaerens]MCD1646343.1 alpha amylase C-terminal domain-containing protein [Marinobacter adhaerens]